MDKETKDNIVFVESEEFIDSAVSFSQYIFGGKRLITIIGELHTTPFHCPQPSMTIAQFCKNAVSRNNKCRVLLEYNRLDKDCPPSDWTECEVLTTSYNALKESNESQMIPSDMRPSFITRQGQNMLYGTHTRMNPTSMDDEYKYIRENFVEPFIKHFEIRDIELNPLYQSKTPKFLYQIDHYPTIYDFFKVYYFNFMLIPFRDINNLIKIKQPIYNDDGTEILGGIYEKLKHAWAAVSDFFIMMSLFKINNINKINECILIVGDGHRANIQRAFEYINNKIKTQKDVLDVHKELDDSLLKENILHKLNDHTPKNAQDCATVFHTYTF